MQDWRQRLPDPCQTNPRFIIVLCTPRKDSSQATRQTYRVSDESSVFNMQSRIPLKDFLPHWGLYSASFSLSHDRSDNFEALEETVSVAQLHPFNRTKAEATSTG